MEVSLLQEKDTESNDTEDNFSPIRSQSSQVRQHSFSPCLRSQLENEKLKKQSSLDRQFWKRLISIWKIMLGPTKSKVLFTFLIIIPMIFDVLVYYLFNVFTSFPKGILLIALSVALFQLEKSNRKSYQ